jgi:uncharacterized DUF497 family protein
MYIERLLWDRRSVEHIARHGITREEVEDVCLDTNTHFTRVGQRRYQAIGQTAAGRYLIVF